MHALSTISSVVGRYGKPKSIGCDIRYSCSLLNQGSNAAKNQDGKAPKLKMCTTSEPMLNIDKNPRMFRQNRFLENKKKCPARKLFCRPSESMLSENYTHPATSSLAQEGSPVAHYTINIFVNSPSADNNEKTFSCSQQTLGDFSVDKLTQNITSNHALIEQFFKSKEFDKNYLEERMQKFWKDLFESSKINLDGPPAEDRKVDASRSQPIVFPSKEAIYANLRRKEEVEVEEPNLARDFIDEDRKPIYANKFFKSDEPNLEVEPSVVIKEIAEEKKKEEEEPDKQDTLFEEIPYYHKWTYDTRTVKATRISAPDNQRNRLTHDNEEVTDKVHNLVRLATTARKPEGRLSKLVSYCKGFIQKTTDKLADDEVMEAKNNFHYHPGNKLGPCCDTRRRFSIQHNQSTNYYGKRDFSSRKQFFRKRKPRKSSKDVIKTFERSRHCLAGAAIEKDKKPRARANTDDQKKTAKGTNLAKNASKGHFTKKLTKMDFSKHCKSKTKAGAAALPPSAKKSKGGDSKHQTKCKKSKDGYKAPYNSAESVSNENKQLRGYKSETNLSRASTTELHVHAHPRSKSDLSLANSYEKASQSCQHGLLPNLIESCDELPKTEYINEDILLRSDDAVPGDVKFGSDGVIQVEKEKRIDGKVFNHIRTTVDDEEKAPGPPAADEKKPPDDDDRSSMTTKILRKSKRKRKKNYEETFRDVQDAADPEKSGETTRVQGSLNEQVAKMEETVQILEEEVSKFEQCMKHDDPPKAVARIMDSPSRIAVDNFEKRYLTPNEESDEKPEARPPKPKTPSYAGKTLSKRYDENTAKVLGKFSYTDFRAQKQKEERVRAVRRSIPEKSAHAVPARADEKKRAKSQTILSMVKKRQPKRVPPKSDDVKSQAAGKRPAPKLTKIGSFVADNRKEPKENQVRKAYSVHGTDLKRKLDEKSRGDCYKFTRSTTIDLSKPISVRKIAKKNETARKTTTAEKKSDVHVRKGGKAPLAALPGGKKKNAPEERSINKDVSNVLKKRESCLLKKIEEHVQKIKKSNGTLDLKKVETKTRIPTRTATLKRDNSKKEAAHRSNTSLVGSAGTTNSLRKFAKNDDKRQQRADKIGSSPPAFKYNNPKAYAYGSPGRSQVALALANRTMATSASKLRRPKTSDSSLSAADPQRRSMSTSAEKRPSACFPGKKKSKKPQKQQYGGSQKKLAKRCGDEPAKPLEYCPPEKRTDESKIQPAVPKQDIMKDIEPMMDNCNQEQLKEYYGQGGYANCEYYKYTRSTFYDLNQYVLAKRLPQPSSGAKPK